VVFGHIRQTRIWPNSGSYLRNRTIHTENATLQGLPAELRLGNVADHFRLLLAATGVPCFHHGCRQ